MKIRKTLKNINTGKNATVYEHSNKIIVVISPQGVIIRRLKEKSLILLQNMKPLKKLLRQQKSL